MTLPQLANLFIDVICVVLITFGAIANAIILAGLIQGFVKLMGNGDKNQQT